jgi:hypothetical protein
LRERLLLDAIADDHLTALAEAVDARRRLLYTVRSATALATLCIGDYLRINHHADVPEAPPRPPGRGAVQGRQPARHATRLIGPSSAAATAGARSARSRRRAMGRSPFGRVIGASGR